MARIYELAGFVQILRAGHGNLHQLWESKIEPIIHANGWIYGDVPNEPRELIRFVDALLIEYQFEIAKELEES